MEDAFLVCFFVGLSFTVITAILSGIYGGAHSHADVGHAEVGDAELSHADVDVGDADPGGLEASPSDGFEMGHDYDHSVAEAGGDGHVEVGLADGFPGLSPWSPTVLSAFVTTFGGVGYIALREGGMGVPISIVLGIVAGGVLAGLLFYGMNKLFRALQSSSGIRVSRLVGELAVVITPIPEDGVGEISYEIGGTRLSAPARTTNGKPVGRAEQVVIVRITRSTYFVRPFRGRGS